MATCNTTCRPFYTASVELLETQDEKLSKIFKHLFVDGPSGLKKDWYWVRTPGHELVWQGSACCKWSARIQALEPLRNKHGAHCKTCGTILNTEDKTTKNCGGDCLKCMADVGEDPDAIHEMYEITKDPKYMNAEEAARSTKERLVKLHRDFYGSILNGTETDLSMVVDILEELIRKVEAQENHSHNLR